MDLSPLGYRNISLNLLTNTNQVVSIKFENALYVPDLKDENLIAESRLDLEGIELIPKFWHRRLFKNGVEYMWAELDCSGQYIIELVNNKSYFTSYVDAHIC